MNPNPGPQPHAPGLDRRRFVQVTSAAAGLLTAPEAGADPKVDGRSLPQDLQFIDVNATLGRWPLRRVPLDEAGELVARLRRLGALQAWVAHFDALLHKDLGGVNARLAAECRRHGRGFLLPFGSINPLHPDAEEELRRCDEVHRMPGLRLFPNYHGYSLDHPGFVRLLESAAARGLIAQIALTLEDERMMHPLMRVEPVDTSPLVALAKRLPHLRLVLVNALRTLRAKPLLDLIAAGNVSVEIAALEGLGGLATLLGQVPASRILFGSHAPLFHPEAAVLKLRESAPAPGDLAALCRNNAQRLLQRPPE